MGTCIPVEVYSKLVESARPIVSTSCTCTITAIDTVPHPHSDPRQHASQQHIYGDSKPRIYVMVMLAARQLIADDVTKKRSSLLVIVLEIRLLLFSVVVHVEAQFPRPVFNAAVDQHQTTFTAAFVTGVFVRELAREKARDDCHVTVDFDVLVLPA